MVKSDGVTVLVGAKADNAADALLSGLLANVGGCLGVDDTVVVWPHGTKVVSQKPLVLQIPHVGRVALGEEVNIGGGVFLDQHPVPSDVGELDVAGVTVPAACTTHNVWVAG